MFNAGLCYAELDDNTKAKNAFGKVIAIDPEYAYAYYALGMAYEKENNNSEAIVNYEKFMNLSNDENLKSQVKAQIDYLKSKK